MDDFPHFARCLEQMNDEPPRRPSFWASDWSILFLVALVAAAVWLGMEMATGGNIASILEAAQ